MTWLKLDDAFADHPKIMAVGPLAAWLHVCAMLYCSRLLTDGFVPTSQVRKLADLDDIATLTTQLVAAGLWDRTKGGYQIHDYLDYNPSRADTLRRREIDRRRKSGTPLLSIEESQRNPHGIDTDSNRPVPSRPRARPTGTQLAKMREITNVDRSRNLRVRAREDDDVSTSIQVFIEDFAREMHDRAPPAASISRAVNLYADSDLSLDEFQQAMYQARERTRAATNVRNRFAYWFTTLADLLHRGEFAT